MNQLLSMINLENVRVSVGGREVLAGVSLRVEPGQSVAVVGPSGCGKTTLLRCIVGLTPISFGVVHVDELKILPHGITTEADLRAIRRRASLVFQRPALLPFRTAMESILEPAIVIAHIPRGQAIREASEYISLLRIEECVGRFPGEMSGGQQQRCALVRALMAHSRYLLCDEITSNLDEESVMRIIQCLRMVRSRGVALIIASHQRQFLQEVTDRCMLLDGGIISEETFSKLVAGNTTVPDRLPAAS